MNSFCIFRNIRGEEWCCTLNLFVLEASAVPIPMRTLLAFRNSFFARSREAAAWLSGSWGEPLLHYASQRSGKTWLC
jgi:hypothetical protein